MKNTDSLRDEIREQHRKMSGQPLLTQLDYYWNYYKLETIIFVLAACVLGSVLHSVITRKDTLLSIAYVNAFPDVADEIFIDEFESWLGINTDRQQVLLDSSYYITEDSVSPYATSYEQKFVTNVSAGTLDVVLADEEYFAHYGRSGFFLDLRTVLSKEQLQKYSDLLFYCDFANDESKEEIPVGIRISDAPRILATSSYPNATAYYGIIYGTKHPDMALSYLEFLETEE